MNNRTAKTRQDLPKIRRDTIPFEKVDEPDIRTAVTQPAIKVVCNNKNGRYVFIRPKEL